MQAEAPHELAKSAVAIAPDSGLEPIPDGESRSSKLIIAIANYYR